MMRISVKKLMKIISNLKREFYDDIVDVSDDYDELYKEIDLFDDLEFEQIEEKIKAEIKKNPDSYKAENNMSEKEKRIRILCDAIVKKMNIDEVNEELKKANLKEVYPRCYNELIMFWCFTNNKKNNSYKVGAEQYRFIKQNCDVFREKHRELVEKADELNSFHDKLTLRKLHNYIKNNSKETTDKNIEDAITNTITFNIRHDIGNEDMTNINEIQLIEKIIGYIGKENTLGQLTQRCEKTRYYYIKLLTKFIELQIKELVDILREMTSMTQESFLDKVYGDEYGCCAPWSIRNEFHKQIIKKYPEREQLCESEEENKKHTVTSKMLYVLSGVVFFEGKPLDVTNVSNIFKDSKGEVKSWSTIRDIGYIFEIDEEKKRDKDYFENKAKHTVRKGEIESLTVENFLDYPIKTQTLACTLFEKALDLNEKEYDRSNVLKDRFDKALQGKVEISREVLLYSIMILNQSVKYYDKKYKDKAWLDIIKINNILNKIGFDRMQTADDDKTIDNADDDKAIDKIKKSLLDHIVKHSLDMDYNDFCWTIIVLFDRIRAKEGNYAIIEMEKDSLDTYEKKTDKILKI